MKRTTLVHLNTNTLNHIAYRAEAFEIAAALPRASRAVGENRSSVTGRRCSLPRLYTLLRIEQPRGDNLAGA